MSQVSLQLTNTWFDCKVRSTKNRRRSQCCAIPRTLSEPELFSSIFQCLWHSESTCRNTTISALQGHHGTWMPHSVTVEQKHQSTLKYRGSCEWRAMHTACQVCRAMVPLESHSSPLRSLEVPRPSLSSHQLTSLSWRVSTHPNHIFSGRTGWIVIFYYFPLRTVGSTVLGQCKALPNPFTAWFCFPMEVFLWGFGSQGLDTKEWVVLKFTIHSKDHGINITHTNFLHQTWSLEPSNVCQLEARQE